MKPHIRIIIVLAIALFFAGVYVSNIGSTETAPAKQETLSGKIEINKLRYVLVNGKTKIILAMIPPAAMDSMNFHPKDDDEITVTGVRIKEGFEVYNATLGDKEYSFRDEDGKPTWKGTSTWAANKKICIGCRLCYLNCPANAIQMVNVNGAFKSQIDQTLCTGCNTCVAGTLTKFAGCPVKAISH